MCLKKRKLVFILFLSGTFFSKLMSQQYNDQKQRVLVDYHELIIDGKMMYLPIYETQKELDPSTDVSNNRAIEHAPKVYNEDWSNTVFNVYWKKDITYPFQLHFEDDVFSSPVDHKMVVTSRYGWRRGRAHQGIDIDLVTGDNVKAILSGKVRYARYHGGHGRTVVIRHDNGLETVYAHLSEFSVKANDIVKKGQVIGKGGISGNARGSHLHLEVRYLGKSIHPEYLFDFTEETKVRSENIAVIRKWMTPRSHRSTKKSNIKIYETVEEVIADSLIKKVYVVKSGDTLLRIADKCDVEISEICKINSIRYNSVLNIGQEILLN